MTGAGRSFDGFVRSISAALDGDWLPCAQPRINAAQRMEARRSDTRGCSALLALRARKIAETLAVMRYVLPACLPFVVACGGPSEPAHFSGHASAPIAKAEDIRELPARPAGYITLGTVTSSCRASDPASEIEHQWLKDVACSEALLVSALRETAAAVGGEILVHRQCTAGRDKDDDVVITDQRCTALVARGTPNARKTAPIGTLAEHRDDVLEFRARDAWRIAVDFTQAATPKTARASRRPDLVDHLPELTPSYVLYGDIMARCDGDCAKEAVRDAVRATAARVGADGITGVECAEQADALTCTGHAAIYAVDPQKNSAAR